MTSSFIDNDKFVLLLTRKPEKQNMSKVIVFKDYDFVFYRQWQIFVGVWLGSQKEKTNMSKVNVFKEETYYLCY